MSVAKLEELEQLHKASLPRSTLCHGRRDTRRKERCTRVGGGGYPPPDRPSKRDGRHIPSGRRRVGDELDARVVQAGGGEGEHRRDVRVFLRVVVVRAHGAAVCQTKAAGTHSPQQGPGLLSQSSAGAEGSPESAQAADWMSQVIPTPLHV